MPKRPLKKWVSRWERDLYKVILHPKLKKVLPRYPKKDQVRLTTGIRALGTDPRPAGCVHLREMLYRIRIGEYRVLYAVLDQELLVFVVRANRRNERTYAELQSLIDQTNKFLESGSLS